MNRILLAEAMGLSPSSSDFRDQIAAAAKYGFTKGNYRSETIELTDLGERLTATRNDQQRLEAMRHGMRRVPVYSQLLDHFENSKLPAADILKGTIEGAPFGVRTEWSKEVAELFVRNGRDVGFVRDVAGSAYVILEAGPPAEGAPAAAAPVAEGQADARSAVAPQPTTHPEALSGVDLRPPSDARPAHQAVGPREQEPVRSVQFFIAHGWDKEALQQVQGILLRFGIPFVVAQDEPNVGRPISQKVQDLMKSCSAGIFIFSADEEFRDKDGNAVWRPRENVVYELGAGSLEYGQRIVIFKERGVYFPSDFSDLGFIEYERGNLQAKAMDLLSELIALKAVRIAAGG